MNCGRKRECAYTLVETYFIAESFLFECLQTINQDRQVEVEVKLAKSKGGAKTPANIWDGELCK